MGFLSLVALTTLLVGVSHADVKAVFLFPSFPPNFGDITDPVVRSTFEQKCIEACGTRLRVGSVCKYNHPSACNVYIECVYFKVLWAVYGRIASHGDMYDVIRDRQIETLTRGVPNIDVCPPDVGHPCVNQLPIPQSNHRCKGFRVCRNMQMIDVECPEGTGYNAWTRECDLDCTATGNTRVFISRKCGPSNRGPNFYEIRETVTYGNKPPIVEVTRSMCPAATTYKVMGKCGCDIMENSIVTVCKKVTSIHLSSSDGTWDNAKDGKPYNGSSSINGNATVVDTFNTDYFRSAFFFEGSYFTAYGLKGNDLGLFMDIAFTFQIVNEDNVTRGFTLPENATYPYPMALIDNSFNNIEPTFGCMLNIIRNDVGQVKCFIKPSALRSSNTRGDMTKTSPEMDLTRRISVLFAKDDTRGRFTVTAEGYPTNTEDFTFRPFARAVGNGSPLVFGVANHLHHLRGYIDDTYIRKYCGPFM